MAARATNQQSRPRPGGGWWRSRATVSDSPITSIETAANSPIREPGGKPRHGFETVASWQSARAGRRPRRGKRAAVGSPLF